MYIVVSKWQAIPGHEAQFEEIGKKMRNLLRSQSGTEFMEFFETDGKRVVIHAYKDEASYNATINDPNGVFMKALEQYGLEQHANWLGSEKGNSAPD